MSGSLLAEFKEKIFSEGKNINLKTFFENNYFVKAPINSHRSNCRKQSGRIPADIHLSYKRRLGWSSPPLHHQRKHIWFSVPLPHFDSIGPMRSRVVHCHCTGPKIGSRFQFPNALGHSYYAQLVASQRDNSTIDTRNKWRRYARLAELTPVWHLSMSITALHNEDVR